MINPINSSSAYAARKLVAAQSPNFDVSGQASVQQVLNEIRDEQSSMQNMLSGYSGGSSNAEQGRSGQLGFA